MGSRPGKYSRRAGAVFGFLVVGIHLSCGGGAPTPPTGPAPQPPVEPTPPPPPPLPPEIGNPCPGVVVRGDPPQEWNFVARATLLIDWEQSSDGFDWAEPYYDDEDDPEDRNRTPLLEVNVAEWRVEMIEGVARHTLEIEWPSFLDVGLHFRSDTGQCQTPRLTCSASACALGA